MKARGSYAKGVAKRDEILQTALAVIAQNGYRKTSIRDLAAAVGLSQTGLLHYFGTKEELFAAVLRKRDEIDGGGFLVIDDANEVSFPDRDESDLGDVIEVISRVVKHNAEVPGLVQLYAQFSTEAAESGHPAQAYFQKRYEAFRSAVAGAIRAKQEAKELPASLDADLSATLLAAAIDGLQTQWMLDDSIDMVANVQYLWERLTAA